MPSRSLRHRNSFSARGRRSKAGQSYGVQVCDARNDDKRTRAKYIKMKKEITNSGEQQESNDELYERFNLTVDQGQEPLRIDKFLMHRIERATRNKLQQAINAGMVLVNGKEVRPNYKVKSQDEIILYSDMSPEEQRSFPKKFR